MRFPLIVVTLLTNVSWMSIQEKPCLLYYLLLRRFNDKEPTAFQRPGHFMLFQDVDIQIYSDGTDSRDIPNGALALIYSGINVQELCHVFLMANAWQVARTQRSCERPEIIHTISASQASRKE